MRMRLSNREYRRMAACCLVSLAIGLSAGYGASHMPQEEASVAAGSIGEACILPDTRLRMEVRYTECGHTEYRSLDKPEWIGKTRAELIALSPGDSIAVFSTNEVCLVRVVNACCSGHLQLKTDGNGQLCVYRTDTATLRDELILTLPARVADMDAIAREDLKSGLAFDSLEEINQYLESMES